MKWICQVGQSEPTIIETKYACDAATKALLGERARYSGVGNYYNIRPMLFYGEFSGIEVRIWMPHKIIQRTCQVMAPAELKGQRYWM